MLRQITYLASSRGCFQKTRDLSVFTQHCQRAEAETKAKMEKVQEIRKINEEIGRIRSTLQMLTNIENKLEELFESIETMPVEKVEAAEKAKEKERRLRLREEKLEAQRIHQEERVRRALERAQADPKKMTGRKLVYRSEPPQTKRKVDRSKEKANKEEEEMAYFFT